MVPDPGLTIRERAIAAWAPAWHGQNLLHILITRGHDVDKPWREVPKKDHEWVLYTHETPTAPCMRASRSTRFAGRDWASTSARGLGVMAAGSRRSDGWRVLKATGAGRQCIWPMRWARE